MLQHALTQWRALGEPSLAQVDADPALRQLTDQILFRFTKLQDAMGERLIPATLAHLAEPYEDRAMRDKLDRLEKLGYLDVDAWLRWRELRNRLAHEYPDAPDLRQAQLRQAMDAAGGMVAAYRAWVERLPGV